MSKTIELLGDKASYLLDHTCKTIDKDMIHLPGADFIDRSFMQTNRSPQVLRSLQALYGSGRLANTGYLSILPVDQGIEHTAGASFAPNPIYFDPENIVKLAIEAGSNAVASTFGVLASVSRQFAHKIPFIVKINHNELLTYPNKWDQVLFAQVKQARNLGAVAIGATIYFGSNKASRQLVEIAQAFYEAHRLGLATILWCYPRNKAWKTKDVDYNFSADITAQANHLGVTIEADIIKQKLPTTNGAFRALKFGKYNDQMYEALGTENPIDLVRLQVINCYAGKIPLLNSGGESDLDGDYQTDLTAAIKSAVINKRAGGSGLIMGRKAFKRPMNEGIRILQAVQDVYLEERITLA